MPQEKKIEVPERWVLGSFEELSKWVLEDLSDLEQIRRRLNFVKLIAEDFKPGVPEWWIKELESIVRDLEWYMQVRKQTFTPANMEEWFKKWIETRKVPVTPTEKVAVPPTAKPIEVPPVPTTPSEIPAPPGVKIEEYLPNAEMDYQSSPYEVKTEVTEPFGVVVSVDYPKEAKPGDKVRITVAVANIGNAPGKLWARLHVYNKATGETFWLSPYAVSDRPIMPGLVVIPDLFVCWFEFTMPDFDVDFVVQSGHIK